MAHGNAYPHQQASNEEVRRLAHDIVRCHLTFLLIVWLALFAPIVCQYHGVMLHFGGDNAHHDHVEQPQPGLKAHEMASGVTMLMSLFVAAMPDGGLLLELVPTSAVSVHDTPLPVQPSLPPPDQPPRSA
jgi:hypothetical protein